MVKERGARPGVGDTGIGVVQLIPLAEVALGADVVVSRSVGEYMTMPHVPKGYSLHPSFSNINIRFRSSYPSSLVPPDAEEILLKNRYFADTDYSLNYFLGGTIGRRVDVESGPISVLEVGGGYESRCAIEIGSGDGIQVTNVDIFLRNEVQARGNAARNVTPILADARDLPLPDESQHIVYSSRLLQYLARDDFIAAFREIARVMMPEGDAVLFDSPPYKGGRKMALTKRLSRELGVIMNEWESNIEGCKVITLFKPKKSIRSFPVIH